MRVSRELLEQMFVLGDRRIVGVSLEPLPHMITEPTAQIVFVIDAPDAPDGATEMEPTYTGDVGTVTMVNPGWVTWR